MLPERLGHQLPISRVAIGLLHLTGAETIARNTGAKIIGLNETVRVMLEQEVAPEQLLRVQGGETHRLSEGVTVRVYPSLHSCIWTGVSPSPGEVITA